MRLFLIFMVFLVGLNACTQGPHSEEKPAAAKIPSRELRSVLADMARAHQQKITLAFWVSTPLRPVGPAFRPFFDEMGKQQAELLKQLQEWAAVRKISLTFQYSDDVAGRGLKIMEERQEKLVRSDGQADFERDILMQMYTDYEWQISLIQALLPDVADAGLRAYLERSLKVHEQGSAEAMGLLRRYKFGG